MNELSAEKRTEIVRLILSGLSVRGASRSASVSCLTAYSLVERVGNSCREVLADRLRESSVGCAVLRRSTFAVYGTDAKGSKTGVSRAVVALMDDRSGVVAGFGLGRTESEAMRDARRVAERTLGNSIAIVDLPSAMPVPAPRKTGLCAKSDSFLRNILAMWFSYKNFCTPFADGRTAAQSAGAAHARWAIADLVGLAFGVPPEHLPRVTHDEPPEGDHVAGYEVHAVDELASIRNKCTELYEYDGEMLTLAQICARSGRRLDFFKYHLKKGVQPADAVRNRYDKLIGEHFGRMEVLAVGGESGRHRRCLCRCKCGAEKWASLKHLRSGGVGSCGCARLEELSGGKAPSHIELFGERLSVGQLAVLAGRTPVSIWARLRRGMTPEEAAFGRQERAGS